MSEWKQDSARRRDVRNAKDPNELKKTPAKKNRKRWCGGHVGREHQPKCMMGADFKSIPKDRIFRRMYLRTRYLICTVCGKQLATYYGWGKWDPPDWVTIPLSDEEVRELKELEKLNRGKHTILLF